MGKVSTVGFDIQVPSYIWTGITDTFHTALPRKLMKSFYILSQRLLTNMDGWTSVSQIFSWEGAAEIIIQTPRNPYICKQL
jgi:hypothetical protein